MTLPAVPKGMRRLITIEFAVDQDGDDFHIQNSTQIPDGIDWQTAYHATMQVRDDLQRQINERLNCPFHPRNVKRDGPPEFET